MSKRLRKLIFALLGVLALPCFPFMGYAQYTPVAGSLIQDASGNVLASGTICALGVNAANNQPVYFNVGGTGGLALPAPTACANVTAGVITSGYQVGDSNLTHPANVAYLFTITDAVSGNSYVVGPTQVSCSGTPPSNCSSGTWSLDGWHPSGAALALSYYVLPPPSSALGGVYAHTCASGYAIGSINTDGSETCVGISGGGGGSGTVGSGTTGQLAQYSSSGSVVGGVTMSGDCTIAVGGAINCTKTGGAPFSTSFVADPGVNGIVKRTSAGSAASAGGSDITTALGYTPTSTIVVPNTAPGSGYTLVGTGSAYVPRQFTGDGSLAYTGVFTVGGLNGVPFCTGFTPTTGQAIEYTTASSPNPCYAAVTPSGGGSSAFSALTPGTNTAGAMHVGSGSTLDAAGSGTIAATSLSGASALPNGTTATTQSASDNSTKLGTTAYTDAAVAVEAAARATAVATKQATGSYAVTNGGNTYTAGTQDASGAAHTLPSVKGTIAGKPSTCTQGEEYFATDATAGQNKFYCTATNTWTQQSGTGGSTYTAGPGINIASGVISALNASGGWIDPVSQLNAAGVITTTTGSISSGSATLTVASATGWTPPFNGNNMGIAIAGAGPSGAVLVTSVTAISGTTFTLANAASTTVSSATINHDDTVALNAAFQSAGLSTWLHGNFNVGSGCTGSSFVFTLNNGSPAPSIHTSPGEAMLVNRSATCNVFDIGYYYSGSGAIDGGGMIENLLINQASDVTPTAGGAFYLAGSGTVGHTLVGMHIQNVMMNNMWGCFDAEGGVEADYFTDNLCWYPVIGGKGLLYYNNGTPAGDFRFDGNQAEQTYSTTSPLITFVNSDETQINEPKLNGGNILFTGTGSVNYVHLNNVSIEGNPTTPAGCGIDFSTGTPPNTVTINSGSIDLWGTSLCNASNATQLSYQYQGYANSSEASGVKSNIGVTSIVGPSSTIAGAITVTGAGVTQSGNTLTISSGSGNPSEVTDTASTTVALNTSHWNNSSGNIVYTLPAITSGTIGETVQIGNDIGKSGKVIASAPASTYIAAYGVNTAAAGSVTSGGALGDLAQLEARSTTQYMLRPIVGSWSIGGSLASPVFSPVAGYYASTQTVTMTSASSGSPYICPTVDGTAPTTPSTPNNTCTSDLSAVANGSSESIALPSPTAAITSTTLQALATLTGQINSPSFSSTYTIAQDYAPFTGTSGAGLSGYTSPSPFSKTFAAFTSGSISHLVIGTSGGLVNNDTTYDYDAFMDSTTPASANYKGTVTLTKLSNAESGSSSQQWCGVRLNAAQTAGYIVICAQNQSPAGCEILKMSTSAVVADYPMTWTTGAHTFSIAANGTSSPVTVSVWMDGNTTPIMTYSDSSSPTTAVGQAGCQLTQGSSAAASGVVLSGWLVQ